MEEYADREDHLPEREHPIIRLAGALIVLIFCLALIGIPAMFLLGGGERANNLQHQETPVGR